MGGPKSPESATKTDSLLSKRKERAENSPPTSTMNTEFKDHLAEIDELLGESPQKQLNLASCVRNINKEEEGNATKRQKTGEDTYLVLPTVSLPEIKLEENVCIELIDIKDEASGPSTVSFAPIIEPDREFSF